MRNDQNVERRKLTEEESDVEKKKRRKNKEIKKLISNRETKDQENKKGNKIIVESGSNGEGVKIKNKWERMKREIYKLVIE